ncbi:thioredoxin reductase [Arthrobacter sp. UYP6]|uniref:FAD-dependent oxidoreductase n=1 Tax=Arthrobacter sp. UYP6 TaxID=1756378 RepID=UPI0033971E9D
MSSFQAEICVVGAGPAGLAAAVAAAELGASVAVVDTAAQPGGQYWRHGAETARTVPDGRGHHGWNHYTGLRRRFDALIDSGAIRYLPGQQVWAAEKIDGGFRLHASASAGCGQRLRIKASRLILCTGAYDRHLPVPGWDLPGVMAAGGIQGFIKGNGILPGKRFAIAGTGPFLLSVAAGVAQAGGTVAAVYESSNLRGWAPHLAAAARVPEKAAEGAEYAFTFAKYRVPYRIRTVITEVLGDGRVEAVRTARVNTEGRVQAGTERTVEVDCVGFGWGFTPQLELPLALGTKTRVDIDGSLICVVDDKQESTVPGLYLAGEITGVGGASLAVLEGTVAGTSAADQAYVPTASSRRKRRNYRRFAEAMHLAHPVPEAWEGWLKPDTTICRCEEVPFASVKEARDTLGAEDARSLKMLTRTGMGWCQGRVCGFAASCLTGAKGNEPGAASLRSVAKRQFAAPVTVGDLAALEFEETTPPNRTEPA